jgi:hypothetical protein
MDNNCTSKEQNIKNMLELSDKLQDLCDNSVNREPYTINLFEYYDSCEPTTSWVLAEIFKYHQNSYILVEQFVKKFLEPVSFHSDWVKKPIITAESDHIDVLIRENDYAIIIENKLKGAQYQRNQLARYINKLTQYYKYKPEQIFIVLLPKDCDNEIKYPSQHLYKSVWCLPSDHSCNNNERHCAVHDSTQCWCDDTTKHLSQDDIAYCNKCSNLKDQYIDRTVTIHKELSIFLNDCLEKIPQSEFILKSIIVQFTDFLNLQYKNRNNDKMEKEIEEFLKKRLLNEDKSTYGKWKFLDQKLIEIGDLKSAIEQLRKSISSEMIDEWYKELSIEWKGIIKKSKSFYIEIQGVQCGCWYDESNKDEPYWAFFTETETLSSKKMKMVDDILEKAEMKNMEQSLEYRWHRWCYTSNGAKDCNAIYKAALELKYLKK